MRVFKLNILDDNYKLAFQMFNLNPAIVRIDAISSKKRGGCLISERTNFFAEKALVIVARLPIMRPYQHGGTRQPDEPAS
ncbi:hypothetical protein [Aeromonas veronii]|uniref:hypothetical protein n=1 Tax=Aeromonas veronii TaxID=654 RepID=UPI001F1A4B06|nr:hypothetical protein [Aeromonas veronii]MCF5841343.1 hypothetical protein [Aeromonas veronii]MCF5886787.1 hypothetical protein [Aeromonas veronii]